MKREPFVGKNGRLVLVYLLDNEHSTSREVYEGTTIMNSVRVQDTLYALLIGGAVTRVRGRGGYRYDVVPDNPITREVFREIDRANAVLMGFTGYDPETEIILDIAYNILVGKW